MGTLNIARQATLWTFKKILFGPKRLLFFGFLALLGYAAFERHSQAYSLAEAMYFEARDESFSGRRAVAAVILNRVKNSSWPNTVTGVVRYRENVVPYCDFSYRCDGKSDNPLSHRTRYWMKWFRIRIEAWFAVSTRFFVGSFFDPTTGSVFYKRADVTSAWFSKEIKEGRMHKVITIGAHEFFMTSH